MSKKRQLIHVGCTAVYRYPERPSYLLVKGVRYRVEGILYRARIQSATPPFHIIHFFKVQLEDGQIVDIEYHEKTMEWYLLNPEDFIFRRTEDGHED
jgi:hypothetical protein